MTNDIFLLPTAKHNCSSTVSRLGKSLLKWGCAKNNRGLVLDAELVVVQAQKCFSFANKHLPNSQNLAVQSSNRRMRRLKKRHGLRFRHVHGESNSADAKAMRDQMFRI